MNHAMYSCDIWILLFFFTKVANPDFDSSIAGVNTPVNVDQESSSFSKNSENMVITSIDNNNN